MAIELLTPFTKVKLKAETWTNRRAIGLFLGHFNPVHIAHLIIADQVRQQLNLEEVRFLPEKPSVEILKMLELATEERKGLTIEKIKIDAKFRIFETVKRITEETPDCDFYFIIGGDVVSGLSHWTRINDLLQLVQLVGVQRPRYRTGTSFPLIWVDTPLMDISSTVIRKQIGKSIMPNFLLTSKVLAYIKKEGLYV